MGVEFNFFQVCTKKLAGPNGEKTGCLSGSRSNAFGPSATSHGPIVDSKAAREALEKAMKAIHEFYDKCGLRSGFQRMSQASKAPYKSMMARERQEGPVD